MFHSIIGDAGLAPLGGNWHQSVVWRCELGGCPRCGADGELGRIRPEATRNDTERSAPQERQHRPGHRREVARACLSATDQSVEPTQPSSVLQEGAGRDVHTRVGSY